MISSPQRSCWFCNLPVEITEFWCPSCHKIQLLSETDEFSRLQLEVKFDLNIDQLEKIYFQLQQRLHPDRFIKATAFEKNISRLHSAALNNAYTILKDPLKRAEHILNLQGLSFSDKDKENTADPSILIDVMELRETLEDAHGISALKQVTDHIDYLFQESFKKLSRHFVQKNYLQALKELQYLKYVNNLKNEGRIKLKRTD